MALNITVSNAVNYLIRPLIFHHDPSTIPILRLILEANLTAFYAPTWLVNNPLHGSGRRALSLSNNTLPPRPIYAACLAANIEWSDWFDRLGGREFDFFVDPGCVSVRYGKKGAAPFITVWSDELGFVPPADIYPSPRAPKKKTVAQLILEQDTEEDDELFAMLADEIAVSSSSSSWRVCPISARAVSPLSDISSSSSSSSSCGSPESYSPPHPIAQSAPFKMSRREQARRARVFVDSSKTDVTPYDGGKTTVLTGGVMLGGGRSNPPTTGRSSQTPTRTHIRRMTPDDNDNWRAIRL